MTSFHPTFRQLEIFLAVADEGGFTAAADRLGISQAAISRQMLALERRLGWELFDRQPGRASVLSERGRLLLAKVPELLGKASDAASAADGAAPKSLHVRVATGELIQNILFLPHMAEFHRRNPDIQVEFVEMPPTLESVAQMSKNHIDLAYFTLRDELDFVPGESLGVVPHGLFISSKHPMAETWHRGTRESLPLVMYLSGSSTDQSIGRMLEQEGLENFHVVARSQRSDMIVKLALEGVGACFAVRHLVEPHLQAGRLVELDFKPAKALHRYKFRRTAVRPLPHVDTVDRFLTPLVLHAQRGLQPTPA